MTENPFENALTQSLSKRVKRDYLTGICLAAISGSGDYSHTKILELDDALELDQEKKKAHLKNAIKYDISGI
ncbi:hypothetical protein L1267_12465 [Pseudoalteromonas sp. OFAV1]|jgi:hypothetical protein|uniref:hypothetical protein n=1 Tax=Pseudoalteromonas sp. OFAV1 TaxID=2908892 RepID=UPI001F270B8F|nr:hypothetical protein [Pseudoalteromonas sp. OFAV1]MCF2901206.1 hypothetical protein [Pseudoalteromonas sp. OFAV1]